MNPSRFTVVLIFVLTVLYAADHRALSAVVSTPCVIGRTAPPFGFWTWPSNSRVNVYLRQPDFSEAEIPTLIVALENWDKSAAENGSNVHFVFRGLSREARLGRGDLSIIRGQTYDKKLKHLARLEVYSLRNDRLIDCALIIVDPRVKNTESLINTIAHEVGHSLGLLDCYQCKEKSTAMGLISSAHGPNHIEGPTTCDKLQVLAGYQELKLRPGTEAATLATDDLQHSSPRPDDRHGWQ